MKRVSIFGRPLPGDSQIVQAEKPNAILEMTEQTAVMVRTHSETLPQQCRDECSRLEEAITTTVRRIRRLTIEQPLPDSEL